MAHPAGDQGRVFHATPVRSPYCRTVSTRCGRSFGRQATQCLRRQDQDCSFPIRPFPLGRRFDRAQYHDFLLAQGLLPPALLRRAVFDELVPQVERGGASA